MNRQLDPGDVTGWVRELTECLDMVANRMWQLDDDVAAYSIRMFAEDPGGDETATYRLARNIIVALLAAERTRRSLVGVVTRTE